MNESEKPQEGTTQPGDQEELAASERAQPRAGGEIDTTSQAEEAVSAVGESIEAGTSAAKQAADDAAQALESYVAGGEGVRAADADVASEAGASDLAERAGTAGDSQVPTLTDRLINDREYDSEATQDDKILAAISYASQLFFPISILVPAVLLISETTKERPFQRYHAVQSLALGIVLWVLQGALGVLASIAGATIIGILCLCFIVPAMVLLWLLPLYYAIQAYSSQRFRIPGLTQFLQDQRWL